MAKAIITGVMVWGLMNGICLVLKPTDIQLYKLCWGLESAMLWNSKSLSLIVSLDVISVRESKMEVKGRPVAQTTTKKSVKEKKNAANQNLRLYVSDYKDHYYWLSLLMSAKAIEIKLKSEGLRFH